MQYARAHNAIYGYRRKTARNSCFLACGFVLLDDTSFSAGFEDISSSGTGIITRRPLPMNAQVKVALNTKKKGLILVEGKICWSKNIYKGWRSGISFNRKLSFEPTLIA